MRAALPLLRRRPPGGAQRWERTNHAGRPVTLLEGPALVAGCVTVALTAPPVAGAAAAAGALGVLDDLVGSTDSKGLKGHLAALRRGEVTTGAVKVLGLGATGLATAWALDRDHVGLGTPAGAVLIAGGANLLNLFDLRPGRALKVALIVGVPITFAGSSVAAAGMGAAVAALPEDLRGEAMMGDTGANALGALLGSALAITLGTRSRWAAAGAVVVLTLASERVSFSRVIASTPGLRELDAWGRPRP
ncbi:hypothetical protein VV01_09580 [Luteipulveratus halotolerans]|uniref:Glycosyl transferase family 4 n=1 Tax=Luteipulveratus halotolerans TaxID=1631356 RepID=A0A0L6CNP3_9MICO|nr:hypothetical protein VV01_09580 [Luteipulveratus halotolerans]